MFFRTVPSANTLVRWVNENAFVFIVQTRPCPTFGRPVYPEVAFSITARYFSSCPSDSTSRWTPCPPESYVTTNSGQRGITPAFGYGTPHPGTRGTLTLLNYALLSAHYEPVRLPPAFNPFPGFTGYKVYLAPATPAEHASLRWTHNRTCAFRSIRLKPLQRNLSTPGYTTYLLWRVAEFYGN